MKRTKEQKGITLIALIITIVVLMILAAVAINSITNEGILEQAGSTANKYNQSVKDEESSLLDYEDILTAANGGYETYEVGDTVTVAGEQFYVIEDKTSLGKVVLLAQKNIEPDKTKTATYLTQTDSASTVAFSTESYWGSGTNPYNIVEPETIPDTHTAAKAAYDYGVKVGGEGRLMTYDEADSLSKTDFSTKLSEAKSWLSSAYNENSVWIADTYDEVTNSYLIDRLWEFDGAGVRPVIEISKSKLS